MTAGPVVPLRVGVIGLGRRGLFLLERWRDRGAVTAFGCDADPAARAVAAGLCESAFETPAELISAGLDAVLLAVPTRGRLGLARLAAAAAAHVVLDPPVAPDLAAARAVFEATDAAGRRTIVLAPRRDEPDFLAAAGTLRAGRIGEPRLFRFERWTSLVGGATERAGTYGPAVPRGVPAVLDQLVALADAAPESVFASPLGADGVAAAVAFAGGRRASVTLHGSASVRLDPGWAIDAAAGGYAAGRRWVKTADGERYEVPAEPLAPPPGFEEEVRRVLAGGEPTVPRHESLRLVALLDAVGRSLVSGRVEPVEPA